jgi:hypothetical protein
VSWAERWATGNRTRLFVIGAILAAAGGGAVYSNTKHQMNGRAATATLVEHFEQCTVEYQRVGQEKRLEKWPCDGAEEFQRRVGRNKVKISRHFIARVRFPLADGRTHEVNVDETQLDSSRLATGATLPVIYAPDHPDDVRAEMSWERLKVWLGMFAVGTVFVVLALVGPLAALLGFAFRGRRSRAWEEAVSSPSERLAPTLNRTSKLGDSSSSQRRPDTMRPAARSSFGKR